MTTPLTIDSGDLDTGEDCATIAYTDADGDGWGDLDSVAIVCELGPDQVSLGGDCDDNNPDATPEKAWYLDADGDGAGDPDAQIASCEPQEGLVDNNGDCDDLDPTSHPLGQEVCDGADNDCDGQTDEEASDAATFYADADEDGYGSDTDSIQACEAPEGYLEDSSDCDDADPWVSPEGEEICDSIDNDCDGSVDFDGWIPTDYATIEEGLDAVPDGAHFCIDEGTHTAQDLSYSGWLTLEGVGSDTVVLDAEEGHFLEIEGDFELSGVHLTNITSTELYGYPGIYQERGAVSLSQVEVSELESPEETPTSTALLVYCYWDCDLTLSEVDIHDATWDHDPDDGLPAGQLVNAWGGEVLIEDTSISGLSGRSYYWYTTLSTWGIGDLVVSNLHISDYEVSIESDWGGYVSGPLDLDTAGTVLVEDVSVSGLVYAMDGEDWSYSRASAPFFGGASSDIGDSTIRRVEISDNELIASGEVTTVYSAVLASYSHGEIENLIVARNVLEGAGTVYGAFFYGNDLVLRNADFVDNYVSGMTLYGAFYSYGDTLSVTNTSFVDNVIEAETASSAAWGLLVGGDDQELVWEHNNRYGNAVDGDYDFGDWSEETVTVSDLSVDPLYTDQEGGDYTLSASSPLIDAGSEDIEDADGSTSDIGAYGGPNSDGWEQA